eukprot:5693146-Pyramimonas_sp.AAC.1
MSRERGGTIAPIARLLLRGGDPAAAVDYGLHSHQLSLVNIRLQHDVRLQLLGRSVCCAPDGPPRPVPAGSPVR